MCHFWISYGFLLYTQFGFFMVKMTIFLRPLLICESFSKIFKLDLRVLLYLLSTQMYAIFKFMPTFPCLFDFALLLVIFHSHLLTVSTRLKINNEHYTEFTYLNEN